MLGWNESAWFSLLVGAALKGTVVLAAAWMLTFALRRGSAAARHLVWTAAAAALLALPVLSVSLPALRINNRALGAFIPMFRATAVAKGGAPAASLPSTSAPHSPQNAPWRPDFQFWMPRLWAAGSLLGLAQMFFAWGVMRRLRRASRPFADSRLFFALAHAFDIHDRVELIESPAGAMPLNFGVLRPAVFLPADANQWSEDRRRVVLLHELAHVKRGDVATNLLMRAALTLFWWNPLAWTAWRESVKERERAADDLVLAAGERASGYAAHLLDIARSMQSSTPAAWAALAMARPSQLEGRLLAILDSRVPRKAAGARSAIAAALAAIVLVAPFAAVQAQEKIDPATAPVVDAVIRAANDTRNHEILDTTAAAFEQTHKYAAAQKLLENSLTLRGQTAGQQSAAYAAGLMKLGDLSATRGKVDDAVDFYTRAIQLGDSAETAPGLVYLANRALGNQDLIHAQSLVDRAIAVAPAGPVAARALTVKGDIALLNGLPGVAEDQYRRAIAEAPAASSEVNLVTQKYARLLASQNRTSEARALLSSAEPTHLDALAQLATQSTPNGIYRVGNGITAPTLLYKKEPEYSEEARTAKHQGTVVLYVVIQPDGHATNVRVIKSLGLGLDEKAQECVTQWKFNPGMRDGRPVSVEATVEINFRLQ